MSSFSLYNGAEAWADSRTGDANTLPVVESQWTDLTQGNLRDTANPLDLAIDGEGLFGIQTPGGVRYTRNGNFRISPAGLLTTADGSPVRAQGGGQIALQPGIRVEVLPDGTVQQSGQPAGQIELRLSKQAARTRKAPAISRRSPGLWPNPLPALWCRENSNSPTWAPLNRPCASWPSCVSSKCSRRP
jgi:flagellar hook-basal body protein